MPKEGSQPSWRSSLNTPIIHTTLCSATLVVKKREEKLTDGEIAGIAIGSATGVGVLAGGGFMAAKKFGAGGTAALAKKFGAGV
jgi:hypothetical protein